MNGDEPSAAGSVAGDVVLSQTQNVYDGDGNVIETISTDRDDTDSNAATGALGQGPLAGFPDSFVLPAGSSPTGAALTMTWLSNIPGANGAGYASNLTANIGSYSSGKSGFPRTGMTTNVPWNCSEGTDSH